MQLVIESVADEFIAAMLEAVKNIKPGEPGVGNYGPATMPKQLDIIASHIKDAIKSGGRAIYGGAKSVKAPYVEPVILVDVLAVIKLFQWQHHTLLHGLKAMKMADVIGTTHVGQNVEIENHE